VKVDLHGEAASATAEVKGSMDLERMYTDGLTARLRGVELPLVVSDHADWDELIATFRELRPSELWITHGREDALMHWCALRQIKARELNLVGYEDEDD